MIHRLLIAIVSVAALLGGSAAAADPAPTSQPTFFSLAATRQLGTAYSPAQIQTAYGYGALSSQSIDGTGQTIALIELDSFNLSDIQQFDAENQLPDPAIREFYAGGTPFPLERAAETTMDLEWAHAMAPGAAIQVYYLKGTQSNKAGWKSMAQVLRLAAHNGVKEISISLGACGVSSGYKSTESALAAVMNLGVSVFVSSGDSGAYPGPARECGRQLGVSYPASDPSVVSVGGTSLDLNSDNTISDEVAWNLSGGGKGKPLPRPVWQVIPQLLHAKYRWAPDVAFDADPNTGVGIYFRGTWHQAGGTSLGAPAWAGIWALIRQDAQQAGKSPGAAPPLLYKIANSSAYSQAFHEITSGGNGHYQAAPGWNPVTGWGTPNITGLAAAVLAIS